MISGGVSESSKDGGGVVWFAVSISLGNVAVEVFPLMDTFPAFIFSLARLREGTNVHKFNIKQTEKKMAVHQPVLKPDLWTWIQENRGDGIAG